MSDPSKQSEPRTEKDAKIKEDEGFEKIGKDTYAKPVKPLSIWQAPQSLLHQTSPPLKQVSEKRKQTYFRRVAMPERYEGPPPAKWQRKMQIAGGIFSGFCGLYIIFLHDYGPREHVFSPIRRMVGINNSNLFQLSSEDRAWITQKKAATSSNQNEDKSRMV